MTFRNTFAKLTVTVGGLTVGVTQPLHQIATEPRPRARGGKFALSRQVGCRNRGPLDDDGDRKGGKEGRKEGEGVGKEGEKKFGHHRQTCSA